MASFRLTNERGEALIGVTVEARATSGQILARGITNMNGVVDFPANLPETGWAPKANITRFSGKTGDMSMNGEVNIQPYAKDLPDVKPVDPLDLPTPSSSLKFEASPTRETGMVRLFKGHLEYWSGASWVNFNTLPTTQPADDTAVWLDCP